MSLSQDEFVSQDEFEQDEFEQQPLFLDYNWRVCHPIPHSEIKKPDGR